MDHPDLRDHIKSQAKTLFVSATPANFEIELSKRVVQQVIRPTGLLDPITYVYPKSGEYGPLISSIDKLDTAEKQLLHTEYDREHIDRFN